MSSHRSGPLKQKNKKHKWEKKRSDSKATTASVKSVRKLLGKRGRLASGRQRRYFTVSTLKRIIDSRGTLAAPFWCVLLPITSEVPVELAKRLLQLADPGAEIVDEDEQNLQHTVYVRSPSLDKHFALVSANPDDVFACIDLINLADWVVMLIPSNCSELDAKSESFLTALYAQGLGDVSFAVMSPTFNEKTIKQEVLTRFPVPEDRIYPLNTAEHAMTLLRHVVSSKKRVDLLRRHAITESHSAARFRSKMLVDSLTVTSNPDADNSYAQQTFLKVQGLLRGAPLYFEEPLEQMIDENRRPFVHLTGWGDFLLAGASWKNKDTTAQHWSASSLGQTTVKVMDNILRSSSVTNGCVHDNSEGTDSINSFNPSSAAIVSGQEADQGDLQDTIGSDGDEMSVDEEFGSSDMSAFCARSMVSSRLSFSGNQLARFREARTEEMFPGEVETPLKMPARERFTKYRSLPNFQSSIWPFEKDTLPNQYDNIACFKNYHHNRRSVIRYLTKRTRNNDCHLGVRPKCIPPDVKVELTLGPIDQNLAHQILHRHSHVVKIGNQTNTPPPLVAWSLLPHENRISVCHFTMKRVLSAMQAKSDLLVLAMAANKAAERNDSVYVDFPTLQLGEEASSRAEQEQEEVLNAFDEHRRKKASIHRSVYNPTTTGPLIPPEAEPIKSKELMVLQAGVRRFITAPIYSTQTTSPQEKAKYEPFFAATDSAIVATVYAPVMYSPLNVLQFRIRIDEDEDGNLSPPYIGELVATGTLHSVDPARLIVKRIFLSAHPYKIRNRHVIARFMFFNPIDVEYFKSVRLQTKSGASGHILESLGTHGAMKCVFDRPLKASDVILMALYKRIFPKWMYQPTIVKVFKAPQVVVPTHQWRKAPDTLQLVKKKSSSSTDDKTSVVEAMDIFD